MKNHSVSPVALASSLWQHRNLIRDLARRDAIGRYKGSFLGIIWSLITPLFMLAIYTFVFSHIFKARWGATGSDSKTEFAIILFAGLIVFNLFSECISRAPGIILGNVNFVKKVVFPLEILPCVNLLSALFHASISIAVLLVFEFLIKGAVPVSIWMIPIVLMPLFLLILGASWWLAATGVFLRDIGQTVGILMTGLMFVSPIFFPSSALPENWKILAQLNPLALPIEQARQVMVWGTAIDWTQWALYTGVASVIAWAGFAWFQKTRKGFADVL
ncbi:ABC transporter permease [Collimonas sp. OK412]|jgi:lipopolysaccharide transport system permease protein|uniref:ABC transporter permease n=1 Tax=Collimonas sp. (strain OK412) TaxID=1801619 RepID=UPI0008EA1DDE|nr:ABC transporter permease [Collimonas sp. OK412]SFC48478.1 ABC-type polysaccharide/polyol phosphate export permease [Collimonas sp. OK412]